MLEAFFGFLESLVSWKDAFDKVFGFIKTLASWFVSFLPRSPFAAVLDSIETLPYLNYLNWFIPVSTFVAIGELWLVAIGVFYGSKVFLHWLGVVN